MAAAQREETMAGMGVLHCLPSSEDGSSRQAGVYSGCGANRTCSWVVEVR